MIEKPDVPDAVMIRALEDLYSVRATALEFVPRGLDANAWAYRAEAGGHSYFVKVSRGAAVEAGAWLPKFLSQRGFAEVIAPLPTRHGEALGRAGDLTLRVQPFVAGERAMDAGMTAQLWAQLGDFLRQLHALELPEEAHRRIRRESFAARRLDWVEVMQQGIDAAAAWDDISAQLFAFWREQRAIIAAVIARTIELREAVRAESWPMTLCHGDIHSGNILVSNDGRMYVIDWDDAVLAPKERDLMFVLAELSGPLQADFFGAYGSEPVNSLALAYYRHDWCIEDIGSFGREILDAQASEAARASALRWFKYLFEPGNSVPTALAESLGAQRL